MGSILAMLNLTFNPMRHLREVTKVGSWLGKPGAQEGSQIQDGWLYLHMHCLVMLESSVDNGELQGVGKG